MHASHWSAALMAAAIVLLTGYGHVGAAEDSTVSPHRVPAQPAALLLELMERMGHLLNTSVWEQEPQYQEAESQEMGESWMVGSLLEDVFALPAHTDPIRIRDVRPDTNPFFSEFGAYDHWIVRHRVSASDSARLEALSEHDGQPPAPGMLWHKGFLWVDLHGNVLPTYRYHLDVSPRPPAQSLTESLQGTPSVWPPYRLLAAGWIDRQTYEDRWRQQYRARAAQPGPQIPAWLGENPPLVAWFIPNGEILTLGELGSGLGRGLRFTGEAFWQAQLARQATGEPPAEQQFGREPLLRYAADGTLLQRIEPEQLGHAEKDGSRLPWINVYFPGRRDLYRQASQRGMLLRTVGSYFIEVEADRFYGPPVAIYDFNGSPLPLDPMPEVRHGYCKPMYTFMLELLYEAQQAR